MIDKRLNDQRKSRKGVCRRQRLAAVYVIVLGATLIISVLGLSALAVVRAQRQQVETVAAGLEAQLYSQLAIEMAWFRINNDPAWRQKMKDGLWDADQSAGAGTYRFGAMDPDDGDLTDSAYDPVVIMGTGQMGPARQKVQARFEVNQAGLRCLEAAVHANKVLRLDGVTVRSYRFVSANEVVEAKNGAHVYADAQAGIEVLASGGTFHGSTSTGGNWPREMPDPTAVFGYYLANGTTIDVADVPFWDANVLENPSIEDVVDPWSPLGSCTLSSQTSHVHSGTRSLLVTARSTSASAPAQLVTDMLQSGETYHTEAWIHVTGIGNQDSFRVVLQMDSSGDGVQRVPVTPWMFCSKDQWTQLQGDATISWTGTLIDAKWTVESQNYALEFRLDDASFHVGDTGLGVIGTPSGWRAIHRQVLSPSHNPFGAGLTNAQGIYVIDCQGAKISIKDCRVLGTLVLLDPNSESRIHRSMHWAPAVVSPDPSVTNLPALMTNGEIRLAYDSPDLDEAQINVNFNPAGTPYQGLDDDENDDLYPSLIKGVIYSSVKMHLENRPTIYGVLVGHEDIEVTGSELNVNYDPVYFQRNAPPGFFAAPRFTTAPGSFKQVVD
jgi:hypothetical protein